MDKKIVQSTKWSGITEFLAKVMTPLINLILARLLTPEVFGVVATFTLVVTFAEVFTDAGFQKYLVQHEFKDDKEREQATNVAFWSNFIFSCAIWLTIFFFRDPIAKLVGSEGYGVQIAVMSLNIPMVALSSIQLALYRRDFRFKQLLPARVASCLTPLLVTVPLAAVFHNSWSMVIGYIAKEVVLVVMLTARSTWKPKLYYSFAKLKEMLSFSSMMMADSFVVWFTTYAGTFIISQTLNDYYTGIYKTGTTTIATYMNLVYMIVAPVLFSALSRTQNDRQECLKIYGTFQRYSAWLMVPLGFGVFMFRDLVTRILLGGQWGEASLILGCTALSMAFVVPTAQFNSDYFRSQGKPGVSLLVQASYAIVMVGVLVVAARQPFAVLSVAQGVVRLVYCVISTAVIWLGFRVPLRGVLKNFSHPLLAALIMSAVAWGLLQVSTHMLWMLFSAFVCILVYGGVMLLFPSVRKNLLAIGIVKRFLGKMTKKGGRTDVKEDILHR